MPDQTIARKDLKLGTMPRGRVVLVDVEMADGRLSLSGTIGHPASIAAGNGDSMGQIGGTISAALNSGDFEPAPGWTIAEVRELLDVWAAWHLNDIKAGCEHQRAAGWDKRPIDPAKPTDTYGLHFPGQRQPSWNLLGWIRPDEHPDGLLTVPCPECGYRYGTEWKREELPPRVVDYIAAIAAR